MQFSKFTVFALLVKLCGCRFLYFFILCDNRNKLAFLILEHSSLRGQGFPNGFDLWGGGQFGQNGQKLNENYKINLFGAKEWRGYWGRQANFLGSGGGFPQFPLGETGGELK